MLVLFIGDDWAEDHHDVEVQDGDQLRPIAGDSDQARPSAWSPAPTRP